MSAPHLTLPADRAPGLSAILEPVRRPRNSRRRLLRFLILVGVVAGVTMVCVFTVTRSWPAFFIFDLLYLAHDTLYLPVKGLLWTSWFPFCLALWIPVIGFALLGLWGWIIGADPSRWAQRKLICWLVGSPSSTGWGTLFLWWIVRAAQSVGLRAEFLRAVISHAAQEALDHIEDLLLAGETAPKSVIDRTLRFVDADRRLSQLLEGSVGAANYAYDLALLAHASDYGATAARTRLATAVGQSSLPGAEAVRAWVNRVPFKDELVRIVTSYDRLDGWMQTAAGSTRGAPLPRTPSEWRGAVLDLAGFALFPPVDAIWAAAGEELLNAIDRLWTALALSSGTAAHAAVLAEDSRRARLATCRELGRRRYRPQSIALLPLWQPSADPVAGGPLVSIAAGPN